MTVCEICGAEVKKFGIGAHKRIKHNSDYVSPLVGKSHVPWNKGLTKETHQSISQYSKTQSERKSGTRVGYQHSQETRDKISKTMLTIDVNPKLSRKIVEYLNPIHGKVWLHSSYELEVAKSLDENKVEWIRPSFFKYEDSTGKFRRYFPDFYLPQFDIYLDPKNDYLAKMDEGKISSAMKLNNIRVIILKRDCLTWEQIKKKI